ncbi:MAG TPA: pantetheine-phosphate adenylyltransferase [Chthoniobacterales bacterium]|jgi:pantetheine-phosphate adenylyltransferase
MRRAIYPGSFDPVTNGHLDVIQRASRLFDDLIVAVAFNDQKQKSTLFSTDERIELLRQSCDDIPNAQIVKLDGLLVDFAKQQGAGAIVRGLRAISDFEFEFQMALMNRKMEPSLETIFMMPKEEYTYISSRIVKEIARLGGNVGSFVPHWVARALADKFPGKRSGEYTP